nr:MAG TPA: AraC-type transcriptional regulator [Caudoviricetes sp.]
MAAKKETGEKLVPVQLFKDGGKYKDDVFVAVNGRSYQIQRGEMVYVPESVAEVLSQSMAQDNATARMIERESSDFVKQAKSLRI